MYPNPVPRVYQLRREGLPTHVLDEGRQTAIPARPLAPQVVQKLVTEVLGLVPVLQRIFQAHPAIAVTPLEWRGSQVYPHRLVVPSTSVAVWDDHLIEPLLGDGVQLVVRIGYHPHPPVIAGGLEEGVGSRIKDTGA